MRKKILIILLVSTAFLAGCGSPEEGGTETEAENTEPAEEGTETETEAGAGGNETTETETEVGGNETNETNESG